MSPRPLIPGWLDDLGLTVHQYRVYSHLWRRGTTYSSTATIARICRIKRDTVFRLLAELEQMQLLRRTKRKGDTSLIEPTPPKGVTPRSGVTPEEGQDPPPQVGQDLPQKGGHKGITKKESPKGVTNKGEMAKRPKISDLVDTIWEATPKLGRERSSREALRRALKVAKKLPGGRVLLDALEAWKASEKWLKDEGQYVEGIHRWISNRAWEDLPEPASQSGKTVATREAEALINLGARSPDYFEKLPRLIVEHYPCHPADKNAIEEVRKALEDHADPAVILAGTKAAAAVIRALPESKRALLQSPAAAADYFRGRRWVLDPESLKNTERLQRRLREYPEPDLPLPRI